MSPQKIIGFSFYVSNFTARKIKEVLTPTQITAGEHGYKTSGVE